MESRIKIIEKGNTFQIDFHGVNRRFEMEQLLSDDGGSCLVYLVRDMESGMRKVLKEFYPHEYAYAIKRQGTELCYSDVIQDAPGLKRAEQHFRKGAERLKEFGNHESTVNYTVTFEDFAEDHGTMYILEEWKNGKAFGYEKADMGMILKVLGQCVEALDQYHSLGYLYLDMKWDNILWQEDRGTIMMIDTDTVVSREELLSNTCPLRSSMGNRSPEFLDALSEETRGNLERIDETTDYYAVGAMLYECVTGRNAEESIRGEGLPRREDDWNDLLSEEEKLEGYDPELAVCMAEFFSKILCSVRKFRCRKASDILHMIKRMEKLANPERLYLAGNDYEPGDIFVGRKEELDALEGILEKERSVVLTGMGGIGKSTLARAGAKRYKQNHDDAIILAWTYQKMKGAEEDGREIGLKKVMEEIYDSQVRTMSSGLDDCMHLTAVMEKLSYEQKYKKLQEVCGSRNVVVILDSFDVMEDSFKRAFMEAGWKVIFTSRCELKNYGKVIPVDSLGDDELVRLFIDYYHENDEEKEFTEKEKEEILRLAEQTGRHTITMELLAKETSSLGKSVSEMRERIGKGIEEYRNSKISYVKDGNVQERTVYASLHTMFDLSGLEGTHREMLRNLTLLSTSVSEKKLIVMMKAEEREAEGVLDSLYKRGWLQRKKDILTEDWEYELHPIISDVLMHEFEFSMDNCGNMVEHLLDEMERVVQIGDIDKVQLFGRKYKELLRNVVWKLDCRAVMKKRLYHVQGMIMMWSENGEDAKDAFRQELQMLTDSERKERELLEANLAWCNWFCDNERIEDTFKVLARMWEKYEIDYIEFMMGEILTYIGMYEKAFEWIYMAAKKEYLQAQFGIGICYRMGSGIIKNDKKAFAWYLKAAEQGHMRAQFDVGMCYTEGEGVKRNQKKAFEWFVKAATQGLAVAQAAVGYCFAMGEGTDTDEKKAFKWYLRAAEQGHAISQFEVGRFYSNGKVISVDITKALNWWMRAAEQGYAPAQFAIGLTEVKKGNAENAFRWFLKAAEQGHADAQCMLGICYHNGEGVKEDKKKAFNWWMESAMQGNKVAQFNVGGCYDDGIGVELDKKKAFEWYMKAAKQGYGDAQYMIGMHYYNGEGVAKENESAIKWLQLAVENGSEEASIALNEIMNFKR